MLLGVFIGGAILGLLECFFGYKIFRFCLMIAGFVFGSGIGTSAYLATNPVGYGDGWFYFWGALAGVMLAILSFGFYRFGVFLISFSAVLSFASSVYFIIFQTTVVNGLAFLILFVLAVLGGIVGLKLQRPAVILFCAFSGGTLVTQCAFALFGYNTLVSGGSVLVLVLSSVLAVFGALVQFRITRKVSRKQNDRS